MKRITTFLITMTCAIGGVQAQPINPWLADGLNRQIQENRNNAQGGNTGPSAAEVRAWHERERKVQAEIAKHKATPYYRAIAYDFGIRAVVWGGGGYYSEKKAVEEALKGCKSSDCRLVTVFFNTCAMVAFPAGGAKSPSEIFVGLDTEGYQAIVKSVRACEAKHGYGNCRYSDIKTQSGDVACTGYDYSVYGQK